MMNLRPLAVFCMETEISIKGLTKIVKNLLYILFSITFDGYIDKFAIIIYYIMHNNLNFAKFCRRNFSFLSMIAMPLKFTRKGDQF